MRRLIIFARAIILSMIILLAACSREKVPDGRIMVKNDTDDKSYNKINVSGSGIDRTLSPGENVILPKSTLRFTVSRAYEKYTRSYTVECPAQKGSGIRIRLIDIHVNRIAGNCSTVSAGKY